MPVFIIALLQKQQYWYGFSSRLINLPLYNSWCWHQLPCQWGI